MKKIAMTFMLFFVLTESHARDCEKWWWEIGETAIASGQYIKAYNDLQNKDLSSEDFLKTANKLIEKLERIDRKLNTLSSCPVNGETDYENRRVTLQRWLTPALVSMRAHRFISKFSS